MTEDFFLPYANQDRTPHDLAGLDKALQDALVDFTPVPEPRRTTLGTSASSSNYPRGLDPANSRTRSELWVATEQVLDPEVFDIAFARSCNGIS